MRPLVTGAAGFMGAHLAARLAREGHALRTLDTKPLPAALEGAGVDHRRVDIRDEAAGRAALDGIDVVFHLASAHLDVRSGPAHYTAVNVRATEALVRGCARAGVKRLVHTSTVGIYGHVTSPPANEDTPPGPANIYERTKLDGEIAVLRSAAEVGLDVIVLRPAWVYGPGCPRTARLLRAVRRGRFFYVGAGRNLRHPVYIDDAVEAFMLAANAAAALAGRTYVVAGPRAVTVRELVETCAKVLEAPVPRIAIPRAAALALGRAMELGGAVLRREPPFSRRSLAFFENDNAFDIGAARRDLGFEPCVDLEEGLRRTAGRSRTGAQ